MPDILPVLLSLSPVLPKTTCRQLYVIVVAMLAMSGRITQLGISRWTQQGGSYRSIQRFLHTEIDWGAVQWFFFEHFLLDPEATYLLGGDETPITKSGKHTYGIDRIFCSTLQRVAPALACFSFALIDVNKRDAYSLSTKQILRTPEEKEQAKKQKAKKKLKTPSKRGPGRPKGSKNKNKAEVTLSPELLRVKEQCEKLLARIGGKLRLVYLVLDGHFGHSVACVMVRQMGLHLISKLPYNSRLFLLPTPEQKARHSRVKYGDRVDYAHLPEERRYTTITEDGYTTVGYHLHCLHPFFAEPINVVVLVHTQLASGRRAHGIYFTSDMALAPEKLVEYYSLRFQIEFTFRDAKQHFGLEDFMARKEISVTNSIGLSFFLVNLSKYLLAPLREFYPGAGVTDLKGFYRTQHFVREVLKSVSDEPDPIFCQALVARICRRMLIHARQKTAEQLDLAA